MRRNNTGSSLVKGAFLCLNGSVLSGLRKKNQNKHSPENDQHWIENEWKNPPMSKEKF